jgi:hypothetical protein
MDDPGYAIGWSTLALINAGLAQARRRSGVRGIDIFGLQLARTWLNLLKSTSISQNAPSLAKRARLRSRLSCSEAGSLRSSDWEAPPTLQRSGFDFGEGNA